MVNIDEIPDIIVQKILSMKSDVPCLVTIKKKPYLWCTSKLKRASSANVQFNDFLNPDITFTNPKKTSVVIKEISLIPDDSFKERGIVKILADTFPVFENENAGDFTDVSELILDIPEGLILGRDKSVKVFFMSSDGTEVSLSVFVKFGDK